ncbi:MAG: hypothetical protein ACI4PM_03610 [Butyricicoccus sp.]
MKTSAFTAGIVAGLTGAFATACVMKRKMPGTQMGQTMSHTAHTAANTVSSIAHDAANAVDHIVQ